jgi:hypothetical protein
MSHAVRTLAAVALLAVVYLALPPAHGQSFGSPVQADLQTYMATRTSAFQNLTRFSFGVYSDIHMIEAADWGLTRTQWQGELRQWRDAGHLFGLIVGDLGYGNATDVQNVLSGPAAIPDAPPVFYAMGNHELDGIGKRAWVDGLLPGAVRAGSWTSATGLAAGNADPVYYSFDVGPSTHFIVLDGDYMTFDGVTARPWQTFGQRQLAWLQADIKANATRNLLVFVHEPIDEQVSGTVPELTLNDKGGLLDLLASHPKRAVVFSGHLHGQRGITRWKGVTSVHVMTNTVVGYGLPLLYGATVTVDGEQITIANVGAVTEFDQHPMNQVITAGNEQVVQVAEDGANTGVSRNASMTVVGPENGVTPTLGSLMLKAPATTWYAPRFISEQLVKIAVGMKFSFDILLAGVVNGNDAVTVQPNWYMKDGKLPPKVVDQNNLQLSQRPRDGSYFLYTDDVPRLNGLATDRWYHREFDLSALAGNYVDGIYLTQSATRVNVGAVYVDNIRFRWPLATAPAPNIPPTVAITAPASGASFTAPASIGLTATAADSDGTIASITYYAGPTQIGSSTVSPYSVTWGSVAAGTYSVTAVARDNGGATTTSAAIALTVATPPPASTTAAVTYVGTDSSTAGSWKGVYGSQGYTIANHAASVPTYAAIQQPGALAYTWVSSTTDPRALTKTAASDRIASTWYGTSMDLGIDLLDGQFHRVALYFLDWDARGRTESVDVLDAVSGALLDTRPVAGFAGGQYVVWNLKGRVVLRIRLTGGTNAVYSAAFFDAVAPPPAAPPPATPPQTTASFAGTNTAAQGNWTGAFGAAGFSLANEGTSLPAFAVVKQNSPAWTWLSSTTDPRALLRSASPGRIASTWYGSTLDVDVTLTDSRTHKVSLYLVDWDVRGRTQTMQVLDAVTGTVLDSRSASNFGGGQYWSWTVGGHVIVRVTVTGPANAVYSGVFIEQ